MIRLPHILIAVLALAALACSKADDSAKPEDTCDDTNPAGQSNRIDIPDSVRRNLGLTFRRSTWRIRARCS